MEKYEKQIGLKTIYLTFARRYLDMLLIFVPLMVISFLAAKFLTKKVYTSSVTISKNAVFTQAQYDTLKGNVSESISTTVEALKDVKHKDGSDITASDLSNLSFTTFAANKYDFVVTLTSADPSFLNTALTELASESVEKCYTIKDDKKVVVAGFEGVNVKNGIAGDPVDSSGFKKYFLIGAAASFVMACCIPFVYEIISDEVWDKKDLEDLGIPSFEIKVG